MIISVTKEYYDAYWGDLEKKASYYWVTNLRAVRRVTLLETRAEASSDRSIVIYNRLQVLKYIVAPLTAFIATLLLFGISIDSWMPGGIVGLVLAVTLFGGTYALDGINWADGYGGPGDGSLRKERLLRKAARISHKTKVSDRIPVSWALGHLYDNPETRSVMLKHSSEITRFLVEGEVAEARRLLALPNSELDPVLRNGLNRKIDAVENDIIDLVKQATTARKLAEAEDAQVQALEAQNEAQARKAGNDLHARLLLNDAD